MDRKKIAVVIMQTKAPEAPPEMMFFERAVVEEEPEKSWFENLIDRIKQWIKESF